LLAFPEFPMPRSVTRFLLAGTVLAVLAGATPTLALPPGSTPRELELGAEAAADFEKSMVFVDDEKALADLQAMIDEIGRVSPRPEIEYKVHIVATPMVNAFVVPGGYVYVTTGLLDMVESDDELFGVLCHEVAHNVNQHAITRMREAPIKKLTLLQLATLVAQAAMVIKGAPEGAILADAATQHITAAVLNPGSVAAEVEADHDGIDYMVRTGYNPAGFLTFMERLASSSGKFFEEELGIHNTHPLTRDRVNAAKARLEEFGVPILRRLVTDAPQPRWTGVLVRGQEATEILYQKEMLLLLAGQDSLRAAAAVSFVGWALDHELAESDIKIQPEVGGVLLVPGEGPPLRLTREDGALDGSGEVAVAGRLRERLALLVAAEQASIRANYQLY
jgi:predicted Zn-dependent protease